MSWALTRRGRLCTSKSARECPAGEGGLRAPGGIPVNVCSPLSLCGCHAFLATNHPLPPGSYSSHRRRSSACFSTTPGLWLKILQVGGQGGASGSHVPWRQMKAVLSPQKHLVTSDDIFCCHNWGAAATAIYRVEARGAANCLRLHTSAPQNKELSGPGTFLVV